MTNAEGVVGTDNLKNAKLHDDLVRADGTSVKAEIIEESESSKNLVTVYIGAPVALVVIIVALVYCYCRK